MAEEKPTEVGSRAKYIAALERESKLFPQCPEVEVKYDFSYSLRLPNRKVNNEIETVGGKTLQTALIPWRLAKAAVAKLSGVPDETSFHDLHVLHKVSGVLKPGTMTLLLAPPGAGKTSFLKALTGRLPASKLEGSLTYSGKSAAELQAAGIQLPLLASYVEQLDVHLPYLTVRETAQFAYENGTVHPSVLGVPELEAEAANRVTRVLELLNLSGCADTVVGNETLRGISGGEKKRVTIAESLVTNARLLAMDEISTGLDAAVTFDIVASIRAWARAMRGTVVIALLQPTPEVYALFDEVIMMREGVVAYHGPREDVPAYVESIGFTPPTAASAADVDMADWLTELLTHPHKVHAATERAQRSIEGGLPQGSNVSLPGLAPSASLPAHMNEAASADDDAPGSPITPGPVDTPTPAVAATSASPSAAAIQVRKEPVLTTAGLGVAWRASELHKGQMDAKPVAAALVLESTFAKTQFGQPFPRSPFTHFWSLLRRQVLITARNKLFVVSRVVAAIVLSLILGSLWWQLPQEEGLAKFGMLLFSALQIAFGNMSEVPFAVEFKYTAYKQISSGMYPAMAYVLAATVVHIPIAAIESGIFSAIFYWMVGLVNSTSRWFFFWCTMFLIDLVMGQALRFFAYVLPNMEAAQTAPGPVLSLQILFSGFLIAPGKLGWLIFMYYLSTFAYVLRSLAQNEFGHSSYDTPVVLQPATAASFYAANNISTFPPPSASQLAIYCQNSTFSPCQRLGDVFLSELDITTNYEWQFSGWAYLVGFYLMLIVVGGLGLSKVHIERNIGTGRIQETPEGIAALSGASTSTLKVGDSTSTLKVGESTTKIGDSNHALSTASAATVPPLVGAAAAGSGASSLHISVPKPPSSSASSVLPFTPMTVTWQDVKYTVALNKASGGGFKTLLNGVSGAAVPGKLLALMGASGAGKTTLLDVISGRKNSGVESGVILLNGFKKEHKSFARLTAYCEQVDVHNSFSTVREALEFSAALRLPSTVSMSQRSAFVEEVLDVLELRSIEHRKVGEIGAADGLSPGQRKILTIGVELCSNAPIIFLDEPTSGLDSRAAALVMKVVRNVVNTGRTVISTIHQPSSEVFFLFDELLLLQRGGYQVYFGPVGRRGAALTRYMEAIEGAPRCPRGMNPASWMLDVLAGTDSSGEHASGAGAPHAPSPDAAALEGATDAKKGPEEALRVVPGKPLSGPGVQEHFRASDAGKACAALVEQFSSPAPGAVPFKFSSVYATNFATQFAYLFQRTWRSYNRNVGYNFVRIATVLGLNIMFGTIWYKLDTSDVAGVQSLVSVIFMASLFIAMISMNTCIPVGIRERAVYYREKMSRLYVPEAYALAFFFAEIPWITIMVFVAVPPIYFMVGLNATAAAFFFYIFVVFLITLAFTSLGMLAAAYFSSADVAQSVVGAIIPLFFAFGGLFITETNMPVGWRWAFFADPISHTIEALVPAQFVFDCTANVNCPSITVFDPKTNSYAQQDTLAYVEEQYALNYDNRWPDVGYLAVYIVGFQILHCLCVRYVSHITR